MSIFKKSLVFLSLIVLMVTFSCDLIPFDQLGHQDQVPQDNQEPGTLGLMDYWRSSYGDGFEIFQSADASDVYEFYQYDNADKAVSFAGVITNSPDFNAVEGYLVVRITNAGNWGKTVGEYLTVHWQGLTEVGVEESTPYKSGGLGTLPSEAKALSEFSVENGYFAFHGSYLRQ